MSILFGERSLTKVAAVFDRAVDAKSAAQLVVQDGRLPTSSVVVLEPGDRDPGRRLEPEDRGIFSTMIRAHASLGAGGLAAGLLIGGALILADAGFASASPIYTVAVAGIFGLLAGLMLGGLVTLRPDHTLLITRVKEGLAEGQCAVVIHPTDHDQQARATALLTNSGGKVIRTL